MTTNPRKFSELIAMLDTGNIDAAMSLDFAQLVEECQQSGKSGYLTLKVKVDPMGLQMQTAQILAEHKVTSPKAPLAGSVLFVGDHGSLHRTDPHQQSAFPTQSQEA